MPGKLLLPNWRGATPGIPDLKASAFTHNTLIKTNMSRHFH